MNTELLTPQQYFDEVKERKQHVTDEDLDRIYNNCLELINKYMITGQVKAIKKLIYHLECIEREKEIIKLGIDTFIYRSDIEDYIDNVAKDTVKIIDLENYERDIPDEIVSIIEKVKHYFTKLYVIFTDYTGKVERQVQKEERVADPILFGVFQNEETRTVIERFYYLGDWVDEYCDLTLDKMVNEMKEASSIPITHKIKMPLEIEELKEQLKHLESKDSGYVFVELPKSNSFVSTVKSFFSRKK